MTTDEQLIERIQSSMNAEVAGLVPPRELLEAIEAPRARGLRLPSLGAAVAALGSAGAVAIAVVALAVIGHGSSPAGSRVSSGSNRPSPLPAGVAAEVRALEAELAILRRPQTAADKLPKWAASQAAIEVANGPVGAQLIPGLTRFIATEPSPIGRGVERVYMVVEIGKPTGPRLVGIGKPTGPRLVGIGKPTRPRLVGIGQLFAHDPSQELHVWVIGLTRGVSEVVSSPGLVPPPADIPLSPAVMLLDSGGIGVVPDGVTRVKWVYEPWGYKPVALYPTIHGNVAIDRRFPIEGPPLLRSATWYGAGGKVIASYSDAYSIDRENRLNAVMQSALDASYRQPIVPSLREHFAVARLPRLKGWTAGGISHNLAAKIVERNPYGLNVGDAHFVPYGGAPHIAIGTPSGAFVIPGSRGACLSGSDPNGSGLPGFSCVRPARVDSGSFHVTTKRSDGSRTIVGLVPDGNASVTVLVTGGQKRTAPVFDNVWTLTIPTSPATLLVKNAAGQRVSVTI